MTLSELLTQCKSKRYGVPVRVFVGCSTLFNGNPSVMSVSDWVKLYPYFQCKVLNQRMINDTFTILI